MFIFSVTSSQVQENVRVLKEIYKNNSTLEQVMIPRIDTSDYSQKVKEAQNLIQNLNCILVRLVHLVTVPSNVGQYQILSM